MSLQVFDAIVVGAGSVGLPTALFLAEAGLKPLVVDQFAGPGQGSNKAAIGGIRATHSAPAARTRYSSEPTLLSSPGASDSTFLRSSSTHCRA